MNVPADFFQQEPVPLARALLGKVLRHRIEDPRYGRVWLSAKIIETEAYYLHEKASHSSLGYTEARRAMFMPAGTIYMYYARGRDSLNFSAEGEGNAVLIKSAIVHVDQRSPEHTIDIMQTMNPINGRRREIERLCSGQTLLCQSLGIKVSQWNMKRLRRGVFELDDVGDSPGIIQTRRLGIPTGRDEALPYRFLHNQYVSRATRPPSSGQACD